MTLRQELARLLKEPNIPVMDWEMAKGILEQWQEALSEVILALISERVEKIRKKNPYDIEFWRVNAETLIVTHRLTGFSMTDRERQNAYIDFDAACQEVLRMIEE